MDRNENNIEKIIGAIIGEAREEGERIRQNGKKSVEEIRKLYKKEAQMDREEIMGKAEREVREIQQRSLSQMGMETRNVRLSTKRKLMESVFAQAEERLMGFSDQQRKELYEKLIKRYSSSHQVTVQLNRRDKEAFVGKLQVPGMVIRYDEEIGSFSGGVIIKEGDVEVGCTFEALVAEAKRAEETKVAEMLFS